MIPYANFTWFAFLLYPVLPTAIAGLFTRNLKYWVLFCTVLVLAVQFSDGVEFGRGNTVTALWVVAGYGLFEWVVAASFLRVRKPARWKFWLALLLALAPLAAVKVSAAVPIGIAGFLGISYVTFRVLDIIICINDRLISSLPAAQFFAYLFFFPTVSAGPIDRYRRFAQDWSLARSRSEFLEDADSAVHRIFTGFLYKFILAALIKTYWLDPVGQQSGLLALLSYMYAYSFYLFFDFAGYSAFAIGLSYLFGIHTPENFRRPFLAPNIKEFWNRWHITLSWWFRDHVYMRVMLSATKGKWFRDKHLASVVAFFITFGLMGLWHGTEARYVSYGLYHALLLSGYTVFAQYNKKRRVFPAGGLGRILAIVLTFHAVCFGFLIFSGRLTDKPHPLPVRAVSMEDEIVQSLEGFEGRLESADATKLAGWAWDALQPDTPISVDLYLDGKLLTTVLADRFRPDLLDARHGNGAHGFHVTTPPELRDGRLHKIQAKFGGTDVDLDHGAKMLGLATEHEFIGYLEAADCSYISGWVCDKKDVDAVLEVAIYDGDVLLVTARADRMREDLAHAGYGDGRHAFAIATPSVLKDGKPHPIRIRVVDSQFDLRNSGRTVQCQ